MEHNNIKEIVCSFDSLYKAMLKCRRGVIWKDSVARFVNNGIINIHKLRKQLLDGKYRISDYSIFTIHEPKTREIVSTNFKDRVFQTSLNDNYLYEAMTKRFIHDNHACQVGKGPDLARNRLTHHLRRHYINHGKDGWVLKCDFKNYFGNTSHNIAKNTVRLSVDDEWVLQCVDDIIDSFDHGENPEVGMGLGSPITQLIQLAIPDRLDHFIKEELKIKAYIRYMDDLVLIHEDKEYLKYCFEEIKKFIQPLNIVLNDRKTNISLLSQGIKFLGFTFRLTDTGKVIRILSRDNIRKRKRKIRKFKKLHDEGKMTEEQIEQSFEGWKAHAKKGNSYKDVERMEKFYRNLFIGTYGKREAHGRMERLYN